MANIVAGALVVGFAVGEPRFSAMTFVTGVVFWAVALVFVLAIAEEES